jgi:hypothetical protein
MTIEVTWDGHRLHITPDPVRVHRMELVRWVFRYRGTETPMVFWTVYFSHGTPFDKAHFGVEHRLDRAQRRHVEVAAGPATEPGD